MCWPLRCKPGAEGAVLRKTHASGPVIALSALAIAGCSSSSTVSEPTSPPTTAVSRSTSAPKAAAVIQLRSVTSSSEAACQDAPLLSVGAGPACSIDGKTTYQLGPSVADLTLRKAEVADEDSGGVSTGMPIVRVQLDNKSTLQLSTVSKELIGKTVAFLIGGRVVRAPIISAQIKDGDIAVLPASPAAGAEPPSPTAYKRLLDQIATDLGAE